MLFEKVHLGTTRFKLQDVSDTSARILPHDLPLTS
jgi:hypothetical protein